MTGTRKGFTLLELLVVVGIIAILAGLVLPSLSRARSQGRTVVCLSHLRELAKGWQLYADENDNVILPGRMYKKPGGKSNKENWYDVGNGLKYRPRWVATMGGQVGIFAFNKPLTTDKDGISADRQTYDNEIYQCPTASEWMDERNYAYGYNHQFLGNARQTNGRFHNFPVLSHKIKAPGNTVVAADCMGTAAGFAKARRAGYSKDGTTYQALGNHGWTLDPPRLTEESDRGTGDLDSPRTAVDPRHQDNANAVYADGHADSRRPYDLGYRINRRGAYVDFDPNDDNALGLGPGTGLDADRRVLQVEPRDSKIDGAHNRFFSGSGRDVDPPPVRQALP